MSNGNDTYVSRLSKYRRRAYMATWTGAGFVGEIACVAAGALEGRPEFFTSAVITCCLLGGAFLAFARAQFGWEAAKIERQLESEEVGRNGKFEGEWPECPEAFWRISLVCNGLAGLIMLIGIWFNGIIWISEFITQLFQ